MHLDFAAILGYVGPFILGFITKILHGEFTKKD